MKSLLNIEEHPLEPFLPINAKLLMLGSFPPQKKRWSMEFFYPNLQNDMWRIFGIIFFQNKDHFLNPDKKVFDKERIIDLLNKKGIALYDTASAVRRLQDNASDKFLEVVEQTDITQCSGKCRCYPSCKTRINSDIGSFYRYTCHMYLHCFHHSFQRSGLHKRSQWNKTYSNGTE